MFFVLYCTCPCTCIVCTNEPFFVCVCVCVSLDEDRCKKCDGEKVVRDRKVLEINVDKGMKDGHKFHFRGESNQVCVCVCVCIV